jgi:hypothetical protein
LSSHPGVLLREIVNAQKIMIRNIDAEGRCRDYLRFEIVEIARECESGGGAKESQ